MTPRELLLKGVQELGIDLSVEQINSIFIFLTELDKWNKKMNLTAIREERDIIIKHVLDSLAYLLGFRPRAGEAVLDMGSGAGFPALPIKIAHPELLVTMVESIKKKASFLRHIVRTLKMPGVTVVDSRTNALPEAYHFMFDVVTARAFADLKSAVTAGLPFLKKGGQMVLSRGPAETISEQELAQAGFFLERKIEMTLPASDYRRAIWILKKE